MNYWTERQRQLNSQLEKDEAELKKRLSSFYNAEGSNLEKQIASYYMRYGEDGVIQYRKLKESLSPEDRKLLMEQMDAFAEKYPQYEDLMPIRKTIYKLDRLEGLQYSVKMQQLKMGAITNEHLTEHLNRQAMRGVNAAAEVMGFGNNFYMNSPEITKLFVNVAWAEGKNFSQRIWENTDKLARYLNTDIAQGFARGDSYEKLVQHVRSRFDKVSRNDAYRLIYTEGTYVMAESTIQPFQDEFEEYRLSTVGDGKVCSICRGIARETFRIKDRQPGVNFPPLHTWCRCTFEIVVEDWDKWLEDYEKRHRNGQSEKVADRFNNEKSVAKASDYDIIKLPRYKDAIIPKEKLTEYALNPLKDANKARAFKEALGYTKDNAEELIEQIYKNLPKYNAVKKGNRGWGMTYEVVMDITGPNGKTARVLTAWIDDESKGEIRLTTLHVD